MVIGYCDIVGIGIGIIIICYLCVCRCVCELVVVCEVVVPGRISGVPAPHPLSKSR